MALSNAPESLFSPKNDGQESTVGVRFYIFPSDLMMIILIAFDLGLEF